MVGRVVQQYQILEKLGAGGMGEIYKAQDTKLNRFVAIKVLTYSGGYNAERHRRFLQEAQAASALNHPNIITMHDIIADGDAQFMVMEYVQGKTLADLIPKGGLRVPQVLRLGLQMTDALQTAHSAGIIHRDLKPGNIMVTESGLVKVLDFGLAKLTDSNPLTNSGDSGNDATQSMVPAPLTMEGSIIGTVSYMSPEQAQGKKVDTRSDVFSLGLVLYEMVTGYRAFQGDSTVSTLSSILRDEARPIAEVAPDVPVEFERLIWQCLRKDPDHRFQTMQHVHGAMLGLKRDSDSGILYRSAISPLNVPPPPPPLPGGPATSMASSAPPLPPSRSAQSQPGMASAPPQMPPQMPVQTAPQAPPPAGRKFSTGTLIGGGIALAIVILAGSCGIAMIRSAGKREVASNAAPVTAPETPNQPEELTNDEIIQMFVTRVPMEQIIQKIRESNPDFELDSDALTALNAVGVPAAIINEMRVRSGEPVPPEAEKGPPPPEEKGKGPEMAKAGPRPVPGLPPPPPGGKAKGAKGDKGPVGPPPGITAKGPEVKGAPPPPPPPAPEPPPVAVAPPVVPKAPEPAPKGKGPTVEVALADGIPFAILLAADIPSEIQEGSPVRFTVAKDVLSDGHVVIAKGTPVVGAISGTQRRILRRDQLKMTFGTTSAVDGSRVSLRATSSSRNVELVRDVRVPNAQPKSDAVAASAGTQYVAYVNGSVKVNVPAR